MIFMGFTRNFNYCMDSVRYSSYRFAKILGVNLQSVSNWKNGVVVPHPKTRQKIADHFGITLAEMDGDELPVLPEQGAKKAPATEGEGEDAQLAQLIAGFSRLSPQQKSAVLAVIEGYQPSQEQHFSALVSG